MSEKRGMQTNTHQLHLDLDILHSLYIIGGNPEDLLLSDTYFFTYISFIVSVLILFVFQKQTHVFAACCVIDILNSVVVFQRYIFQAPSDTHCFPLIFPAAGFP